MFRTEITEWASLLWAAACDQFDVIAGWASIVGVCISVYVMIRLRALRDALVEHEIGKTERKLFEQVNLTLIDKPVLTSSHKRDINSLLMQVHSKYSSRVPFRGCPIKTKIKEIRGDLDEMVTPNVVSTKLEQLQILIDAEKESG
jgi:hypothetical protein